MAAEDQEQRLKLEIVMDPEFKTVHIDGAIVTLNPNFGQLALTYDLPEFKVHPNGDIYTDKVQKRVIIDARLSPEAFRALACTMMEHMQQYDEWLKQQK
jgi:hypothetical protein